jgi:uncharacterized protein
MEFEWDLVKEELNIRKHGLTFAEGVECFRDPLGLVLTDKLHSTTERRYYLVGKNLAGRVLTVRYTRRGNNIRLFGVAEWRKFRELYNERTKTK